MPGLACIFKSRFCTWENMQYFVSPNTLTLFCSPSPLWMSFWCCKAMVILHYMPGFNFSKVSSLGYTLQSPGRFLKSIYPSLGMVHRTPCPDRCTKETDIQEATTSGNWPGHLRDPASLNWWRCRSYPIQGKEHSSQTAKLDWTLKDDPKVQLGGISM